MFIIASMMMIQSQRLRFLSVLPLLLLVKANGVTAAAELLDECTAHVDCRKGLYCGIYHHHHQAGDRTNNNNQEAAKNSSVCLNCFCNQEDNENEYCPDYCLCSSSEECPTNWFCQVMQDKDYNTLADIPQNERRGTCAACQGRCSAERLMTAASANETCQDVCPNDWECNRHEDCGGDGNDGSSSWCTVTHKCLPCTRACFSPQRFDGYEENPDYKYYYNWEAYESIDLSCPENCCNWGLDFVLSGNDYESILSPQESSHQVAIAPCNSELLFDAYWTKGAHSDWTATEFKQRGRKCSVQRYEFDDGLFPPVVTTVSCPFADSVKTCDEDDVTVALLQTTPNDPSNPTFANISVPEHWRFEKSYPMTGVIDKGSDTCTVDQVFRIFTIIIAIVAVVALFCIIGCIWACVKSCRGRRAEQDRQEQPIVVVSAAAPPTAAASLTDEEEEDDDDDDEVAERAAKPRVIYREE